jgi:hypothetical protein
MASDGGYYSPSGYILRRRMGRQTGHKAVDRTTQPSPQSEPMADPMANPPQQMGATTQPPKRPFIPYIPNENTGITGKANVPFNSFPGASANPLMDYLQQMLRTMRPR